MTKSWNDVRDLVYKLYLLERKSLSQTREIIRRERGFEASPRAYRMKLKEWRIKRSNVTLSMGSVEESVEESSIDGIDQEDISEIESSIASPSRSIQPESSIAATQRLYEELFERIKEIRMSAQAFPLIQPLSFQTGTDTFLHYVARQPEDILTGGILVLLTCMREQGHSIDIRDASGSSALEIAIRSDLVDNVSVLLASGASVHTRNRYGEQPLHVALRSSVSKRLEMCVLLLANGADPSTPVPRRLHGNDEAPEVDIWAHTQELGMDPEMLGWQTDPEVLAYCHMQHQAYFGHGTRFNPHIPVAFHDFVETLRHGRPSHAVLDFLLVNCITFFLRMGSNPVVPGGIKTRCRSGRCNTVAAFMLFHFPNVACAEALVAASLGKYCPLIVKHILHPCGHYVRPFQGKRFSELLRELLERGKQYPIDHDSLTVLLSGCSDDEVEKPAMLRVLIESHSVDVHLRDSHGIRPIQYLLNMPTPLQFKMAEIMMSTQSSRPLDPAMVQSVDPTRAMLHPLWPLQQQSARLGQLYAYVKGCAQWRYGETSAWHDGSFETCGCSLPVGTVWSRQEMTHQQLSALHRCLAHVFTKSIVRDWGGTLPMGQICDALRLRDALVLPPLEIESRDLLHWLQAS